MSSKSAAALEFSIERLGAEGEWLYLWTFTFADQIPAVIAASRWSSLNRDLVRTVGFEGVRVFELHPGGHGLHVHCVVKSRHDVRTVRKYANRHGFGRINVKAIPSDRAAYVAKYLWKSKRAEVLRGRRLWAGIGFDANKVRDIIVDSPLTRKVKEISVIAVRRFLSIPDDQELTGSRLAWAKLQLARVMIDREVQERAGVALRAREWGDVCRDIWGDGEGETDFRFGAWAVSA